MPDYSNEATRAVIDRIGPFDYEKSKIDSEPLGLVDRGPIKFDTGIIYHGQWNEEK